MANAVNSRKVKIKRGDIWDGDSYTIQKTGFDFTGATVKMEVRDKPDGTIYVTLNPSASYPSLGNMTFSVSFTGAQTATFPAQKLVADVEIKRTSPPFGPYTVFEYEFDVEKDVTQ